MKHFLTFLSVVLLPLACVGAPSYTTYFNNTHTYTNASVGGSIFVGPDTLNYWGPPTATDVLISISTNQIQRHLVAATYNAAGKGAKWDIDTRFHEANEILSAESDGHGNSAISFQVRTNFVIVDIASSETSSANFGIYTDQSGVIQMELESANSALTGFYPTVTDGASALAYLFDTRDALSTAGAKLASFKNDGSEKFSIAHDGSITASGSALVNSITATNGGTFRGEIVSTLGTITADASALDATATWNNAGVTFTGLKMNITDTASAAASLLLNLQIGGSSVFTIGKSGGISIPSNSATFVPLLTSLTDNDTGFNWADSNQIWIINNGGYRGRFDNGGLLLSSACSFAFASSASSSASGDTFLFRDAANTFQAGSDSATASAQTFKGPDGSGTDKVGGALNIAGGKSTGTAASGAVILQTANSAGASGSSVNTLSERFHAIPKWVTLTSATETTIFTIPVPATNYVGLTATVTIYATDGTDHQSKTSVITCDAINKAGTITETLTQVDNTTAASSGTLTATYDSVDAGSNVVGIRVAADSSLAETVLRAKIVVTAINSNGTAALVEQ